MSTVNKNGKVETVMLKTSKPPVDRHTLKVRPIQKSSISDDIVQQIMEQISTRELEPGMRLPSERDLCKQFNASRSSLREALRCLSIMGVLTARAGEGTSIAADGGKFLETVIQWRFITETYDIRNLMELRIALEGLAAASSAERATDEDVQTLEGLVDRMGKTVQQAKKFAELDLEFHLALARASKNQVVVDLVSMIRGQLTRTLSTVLTLQHARPLSVSEHAAIVKAIKRRDADGARTAMQNHLNAAMKRYHAEVGNR
jgi:GntR family transcriptional regulator, transcriptional repressor for pyruvate dehydrogenase complex